MNSPHNDQPIKDPAEDRFGIDPFAKALAKSITNLKAPNGSVVALNGPWGSGKSSAVNLIRHHLKPATQDASLKIIDFTCWWFRGEEALALAFFRELYAGLTPTLNEKIKKVLPKLGARLLRAGTVLGGVADAAGAGGAGSAAGGAMEWLGNLIGQDESVESLHDELSKALEGQDKRFLVIIDDIDRLSPDEALLIFRLVKSVGRLPNVMYLLVYDQELAEKVVHDRYPSEGAHYLEKIVQASFELPEPTATDIQNHLLTLIGSICGTLDEKESLYFMNLFYEGIAPQIRTPRDVTRLSNVLSVTWPAVSGAVNVADFVTLEVLRLTQAKTYRAIRQSKDLLCQIDRSEGAAREAAAKRYDDLLFGVDQKPKKERHRRTLMRLFPSLEAAWRNHTYAAGFKREWAKARRVCSPAHFDSYFRFSISEEAVSNDELSSFIERISDRDFIMASMRHAVSFHRRAGGTKAAVILDELNAHADQISKDKVLPLLSALFAVSDEIDVEADEAKAFSIGSNELRIHWLMRNLILDRTTLDERSDLLRRACESSSLGWLAHLSSSAWHDYHPRKGENPEPPENCLTTEADAGHLRGMLRERITAAALDGSLAKHRSLAYLLFQWDQLCADDGATVKAWTAKLIESNDGVNQLAKAFTSYSWSHGMGFDDLGDLVARRSTEASTKGLAKVTDVEAFRERLEAVSSSGEHPDATTFLEAWKKAERGKDED